MYKNILGPDNTSSDITMRCILSTPRSGSTFIHIFLHVYNALLNKQTITDQDLIYDGCNAVVVNGHRVITGHTECPGFRTLATPKNLAKWDLLCDSKPISYLAGDHPSEFANYLPHTPAFARSKMVFLFRNPLDQILSLYFYTFNNNLDSPMVNLKDFIHKEYMFDWYIKIFYPFHIVRQHYSDMMLCVSYEQLMADKPNALRRILAHLGLTFDQDTFTTALELTSIESLKFVEQRLGRSLRGGKGKHIHSGNTGLWQDHMSLELVEYIEERLNHFELSLKMFTLAKKLSPEFAFLNDSETARIQDTLTWIFQRHKYGFRLSDNTRIDPQQNPFQLGVYNKPRVL